MITMCLIRETDLITHQQVVEYAEAQRYQLRRHFGPEWGTTATVITGRRKGCWPVYFRDFSDVLGALGYHEWFEGLPRGFVFIGEDQKYGLQWPITASHEVLEMAGNPTADAVRPYPNGQHIPFEACDPCQADRYGYRVGNTMLSDYVHRAWFNGVVNPNNKHPYDRTGVLKAPLSIAPGGYLAVEKDGEWHNEYGATLGSGPPTHEVLRRHYYRRGFDGKAPA